MVPTQKVPPRSQPKARTLASMAALTLLIGTPDIFCNPVIQPSLGPGPRFAVRYRPLPIPISKTPASTCRSAGAEMIGAVRGIDPQTGYYFDDTRRYIENSNTIDDTDRNQIFDENNRRVFSRLRHFSFDR